MLAGRIVHLGQAEIGWIFVEFRWFPCCVSFTFHQMFQFCFRVSLFHYCCMLCLCCETCFMVSAYVSVSSSPSDVSGDLQLSTLSCTQHSRSFRRIEAVFCLRLSQNLHLVVKMWLEHRLFDFTGLGLGLALGLDRPSVTHNPNHFWTPGRCWLDASFI